MAGSNRTDILKQSWEAFGAGEMDRLAGFYAEDMIFVLPGQDDVLRGRAAFREALDGIGQAVPPGFDVKEILYFEGDDGIVNLVRWTADKLPDGSQSAILFAFDDADRIVEERWFVDTEQWKAAF
jgi:ketosteroid isomerase-like protein